MDQELLHFDDSDAEEEGEAAPSRAKKAKATKGELEEEEEEMEQEEKPDASQKVLTTAMVQAWCTAAKEQHKLVRVVVVRCCCCVPSCVPAARVSLVRPVRCMYVYTDALSRRRRPHSFWGPRRWEGTGKCVTLTPGAC